MLDFDVVIVGAGIVGLATACALQNNQFRVALVDPTIEQNKIDLSDTPMLRASAINGSSQRYFQQIGIWDNLLATGHVLDFSTISVWEKNGSAKLAANCHDFQYDSLGYIIENKLMQNILYEQVSQSKSVTLFNSHCHALLSENEHSVISLDNNELISAKLVIAADGANSWIRKTTVIPMIQRPYKHHALMATVETEFPHQACARQVFYPQGIVAFLPLWQPNMSCLVWSAKPEKASELAMMNHQQFADELSALTDYKLGRCKLVSERAIFPLTARYAKQFVKHRLALIGDAAHTIHPLAGQGVNLGLQDSYLLTNTIKKLHRSGQDIGLSSNLRGFQCERRRDTAIMLAAMQGIQDIFNGDAPLKKMIRGVGMNMINHAPIIKKQLIKHAMGL